MPKQIDSIELERIIQAISQHPEGLGLEQLLETPGLELGRRTMQRRISKLIKDGRLATEGGGRYLRYKVAPVSVQEIGWGGGSGSGAGNADGTGWGRGSATGYGEADGTGWGEVYVPLSHEGQEIKKYVRQAAQLRKPVSYNSGFLESYHPNETPYLPEKLRLQLHSLGKVPDGDDRAGTFAREILSRLLIDLSWASSKLEGNTYSRLDTQKLIEFGQTAEGKDAVETQMILNHKSAIEMLVGEADVIGFNTFTILNLHAQLSDGLLANPLDCGRLRQRPVDIGGSVYIPLAMPQRLEEYFRLLLTKAESINDPFEQSFFAMAHLSYLQPFIDVNKRVSRLAANIPLIKRNLCPLSFIDVPERAYVDGILGVYELNRMELLRDVFIWAYERSCQQYVAVKQSLVPPDALRLKYRAELAESVRSIVKTCTSSTTDNIRATIRESVSLEERERFVELVQREFESLYEGNIARFGIRPYEFSAWRKAVGK